jgi:hypothetical protein
MRRWLAHGRERGKNFCDGHGTGIRYIGQRARAQIEISFVGWFCSSVYTGRMPLHPSVCVMKKGPDLYEVDVTAAPSTLHCVTAGVADVEHLTGGKANAERLIEESFHFLLEREANTSILRSFHITEIGRYFPEYEREIRRRLGK